MKHNIYTPIPAKSPIIPIFLFGLILTLALALFLSSTPAFTAPETSGFGGKSFKAEPALSTASTDTSSAPAPHTTSVAQFTEAGVTYAAVTLTFAEGYYAYAHTPEVAKPTELTLFVAGQPVQAEVLYPPSVLRPDFFEPTKQVPAYEGTVSLFLRLPDQSTLQDVTLRLSMLVCSAKNCRPVQETLPLPALATPSASLLAHLADAKTGLPLSPFPQKPSESETIPADFPPKLTPRYSDPGLEPGALFTALWLGLLAGLVLNVMPCVLPVLTIKITALLGSAGGGDEATRFARFREHNLFFAAGILTWFIALALAVSLLGLAWGGLFQQVGVVYGLLILVFLLGLSLFDVFTLPVLDFKVAHSSSPRLQAYLSGVVVTLLATPCSGPLLGGVLGWAASQPLHSIILVFISTGLGMSMPYLLLAISPRAARLLPRPGAWTGIVERLAGFFLMGTALYLLSVLPDALHFPALCVLLIAALCAWLWGNWGYLRPLRQQVPIAVLCFVLLSGSIYLSLRPAAQEAPWIAFSPASFTALTSLTSSPLLVEFTADWCPTCKVLERTVLTPETLRGLVATYDLQLMKVDMTRPDPAAEALLRALGSVSIPVTAIFTPASPTSPVVLRDLYTTGDLTRALKTAIPTP